MFSWFLKLLGIDEDRPSASANSYLDTSSKTESEAVTPVAEKTAEPKSEDKEPETKEVLESVPEVVETSPEPEPASKSLSDELPDLKVNYIKVLEAAGFISKSAIDKASDKELLALKGIGKASLKIMRA